MVKMANKWYGWIPLLTKEILFEYSISYFKTEEEVNEITDENEKNSIDKMLSKSGEKYFKFSKKQCDLSKKKSVIVVSIDKDYKINYVIIFNDKEELEGWGMCKIQTNGLVRINIGYQKKVRLESNIIRDIYIIIRDIYHQHTHHKSGEKHEDILLGLISAKDEEEAIKKINEKFQRKIIKRHKRIRKLLDITEKKVDIASELITKAKGEMTYAISFVELFKKILSNSDQYYSTYLNAIRSIDILEKEIEMHYTSKMNEGILHLTKILTFFTIGIGVITFVMAVDASFDIIETLSCQNIDRWLGLLSFLEL